jgi:hypothetical protein
MTPAEQTLWAARQWEHVARQEENTALWEAQVFGPGHSISSNLRCSDVYRRTAKSLYLEFWTGESHCACCLATTCLEKKKARSR